MGISQFDDLLSHLKLVIYRRWICLITTSEGFDADIPDSPHSSFCRVRSEVVLRLITCKPYTYMYCRM